MIISRSKTVKQNLLDLIKASNTSLTMTVDQFDYDPTSIVADNSGVDNNTRVTVTARSNAGFKGTRDLHYKRCDLTDGLTNPITTIERATSETDASLISRVVTALNIHTGDATVTVQSSNVVITTGTNPVMYNPSQTKNVSITAPTALGVLTFTAASKDNSIKGTYIDYGVAERAIIGVTWGTIHATTGLIYTYYAKSVTVNGVFLFGTYSDGGYTTNAAISLQFAGMQTVFPTTVKVYNDTTNALIYSSSARTIVQTAPDDVSTSFNALSWPSPSANWLMPTGVRLRAEFS